MKEVQYTIHWGGYIGAEDTYSVFVDDDASEWDIENAISEDYEEKLHDECYWEKTEEEE